jgi:hypothetical protein
LTYDGKSRSLKVRISAHGFVPGTTHAAHIHLGSCQKQGPVIYALPDLVAGPAGKISATATLSGVPSAPPASGWYVNIHLGNSGNTLVKNKPKLAFRPLLCGNIGGGEGGAESARQTSGELGAVGFGGRGTPVENDGGRRPTCGRLPRMRGWRVTAPRLEIIRRERAGRVCA